jgi:twitching motility two-component system response regulator PilG
MKVLIVDDTKTMASLLRIYLTGYGLEFISAEDGRRGLEAARTLRPDLVITDVCMPGLDGFELTAAIRADPHLRRTPVVMLTTLKDEESRAKGREVGATGFLSKPVPVTELRALVSELLHADRKTS